MKAKYLRIKLQKVQETAVKRYRSDGFLSPWVCEWVPIVVIVSGGSVGAERCRRLGKRVLCLGHCGRSMETWLRGIHLPSSE